MFREERKMNFILGLGILIVLVTFVSCMFVDNNIVEAFIFSIIFEVAFGLFIFAILLISGVIKII